MHMWCIKTKHFAHKIWLFRIFSDTQYVHVILVAQILFSKPLVFEIDDQ